jgi:hypothetical protein
VGDKTVASINWKMSVPKKRQTYNFYDKWEIELFFVIVKDKCLISNASVSLAKRG